MPAFTKSAIASTMAALAMAAGLVLTWSAEAQTTHRPIHRKIHALTPRQPDLSPLAPGAELHPGTYASPGSENHYYSDTVASSHEDLMELTHRFGQSTQPVYNSTPDPLFRF
jgi:hypothetical protein